jgi:hypothetical protein
VWLLPCTYCVLLWCRVRTNDAATTSFIAPSATNRDHLSPTTSRFSPPALPSPPSSASLSPRRLLSAASLQRPLATALSVRTSHLHPHLHTPAHRTQPRPAHRLASLTTPLSSLSLLPHTLRSTPTRYRAAPAPGLHLTSVRLDNALIPLPSLHSPRCRIPSARPLARSPSNPSGAQTRDSRAIVALLATRIDSSIIPHAAIVSMSRIITTPF